MDEVGRANLLAMQDTHRKDGTIAPFYFDIRKAQSHQKARREIAKAFSQLIRGSDKSLLVAGIPEAMTPLASIVGHNLDMKLVQPRANPKTHGLQKSVEGDFEPGERVILLDDVINSGDSKLKAIEQINNAGLEVEKLIVLIDGEQGGVEAMRAAGYEICTGFTITSLLHHLLEMGKITQNEYDIALDFVRSN